MINTNNNKSTTKKENNQKTTNELADFGRLTNLPTCELVKLDYIVANQEILSSPVYVNNFRATIPTAPLFYHKIYQQ